MLKQVFALYDVKTSFFHPPIACVNEADFERLMRRLLLAGDSVFAENPGDFQMWCIGKFDDNDGRIGLLGMSKAECIGSLGSLCLERKENDKG